MFDSSPRLFNHPGPGQHWPVGLGGAGRGRAAPGVAARRGCQVCLVGPRPCWQQCMLGSGDSAADPAEEAAALSGPPSLPAGVPPGR